MIFEILGKIFVVILMVAIFILEFIAKGFAYMELDGEHDILAIITKVYIWVSLAAEFIGLLYLCDIFE
jgi:hypothetical protein